MKINYVASCLLLSSCLLLNHTVLAEEEEVFSQVNKDGTIENYVPPTNTLLDENDKPTTFEQDVEKTPKENKDVSLFIENIDVFSGDLKFVYYKSDESDFVTKFVSLPELNSGLIDEKFDGDVKKYISELYKQIPYYYVLTENEVALIDLIDFSLIDDKYETIIFEGETKDYFIQNTNDLIKNYQKAKEMSKKELLNEIKKGGLIVPPSAPYKRTENLDYDVDSSFELSSYSSKFLSQNFKMFYNNSESSSYNDEDGTTQLKKSEKEEPTKNTQSSSSNTFIIVFSFIFLILFIIFFFVKRKK